MNVAVLFSGGKDSIFTVYKCLENNYNVKVLVSMFPENKESFMFHTPNIHLTKLQAEALEFPFYSAIIKGEKEKEVDELFNNIKKVKKEYNVECLGVGAFASEYQYNRVAKIAEELNLKVFTPLWKKEPKKMVQEMIDSGFEIILSAIAANGFTKDWLGKTLDNKAFNELCLLNEKYHIHIAGEGGEFESLVLNGPIFKKKLTIIESEKHFRNEFTGFLEVKKAILTSKLTH